MAVKRNRVQGFKGSRDPEIQGSRVRGAKGSSEKNNAS